MSNDMKIAQNQSGNSSENLASSNESVCENNSIVSSIFSLGVYDIDSLKN